MEIWQQASSDAWLCLFREACVNFLELCTKKSDDGMWMHEVAAMQASELPYFGKSGIVLAGEEKLYSQDTMMNQNELASNSAANHGK